LKRFQDFQSGSRSRREKKGNLKDIWTYFEGWLLGPGDEIRPEGI